MADIVKGQQLKSIVLLRAYVWNISGANACGCVEERLKTAYIFLKIIFQISFCWKASGQIHQCKVTFVMFSFFKNNLDRIYYWAAESGGEGRDGSSLFWSWRWLKLLCVSAWWCQSRTEGCGPLDTSKAAALWRGPLVSWGTVAISADELLQYEGKNVVGLVAIGTWSPEGAGPS